MNFWTKKTAETAEQSGWKNLETTEQLATIIEASNITLQVIFKHSTRCSISSMAKARLERGWNIPEDKAVFHYLDLIAFRPVSNQIAETLGVEHQSPQIIVLKDGKAIFNTSHNHISVEGVAEVL